MTPDKKFHHQRIRPRVIWDQVININMAACLKSVIGL